MKLTHLLYPAALAVFFATTLPAMAADEKPADAKTDKSDVRHGGLPQTKTPLAWPAAFKDQAQLRNLLSGHLDGLLQCARKIGHCCGRAAFFVGDARNVECHFDAR